MHLEEVLKVLIVDRLAEFATVILVGCFPIFPRLWKYLRGEDNFLNSKYSRGKGRGFMPFKNTDPNTLRKYEEWGDVNSGESHSSYVPLEKRSPAVNDARIAREAMDQSDHASFAPTSQAIIYKSTNIVLEYGREGYHF